MKHKKRVYSITIVVSLIGILSLSITSFVFLFKNSPEQKNSKVAYSVTKGNENLIHIASDGLDPNHFMEAIKDNTIFKDFYSINNYVGPNYRSISFRSIYNGWDTSNPYNDLIEDGEIWGTLDHKITEAVSNKINLFQKYFDANNLVNPINFSGVDDPRNENSGNVNYLNELNPNINVFDWKAMRDYETNNWGVSTESPDALTYKFSTSNYELQEKGSHNILQDLITHSPYATRIEGQSIHLEPTYPSSIEFQEIVKQRALVIERFILDLQSIRGTNGRSVYDNSLIILHGDHASHYGNPWNIGNGVKNKSLMLIKYPDTTKSALTEIDNRLVFAPHTNNIVEDWFKNYQGEDNTENPIDFILENKNFDIDRKIPVYISGQCGKMWLEQLNTSTGKMMMVEDTVGCEDIETIKEYSEVGKWES